MVGVWIAVIVGTHGHHRRRLLLVREVVDRGCARQQWMTWTGSISLGMFALGVVVYFFGRRSAHKMTQEDALAHLAVLDLKKSETPSPEAV